MAKLEAFFGPKNFMNFGPFFCLKFEQYRLAEMAEIAFVIPSFS